MRVEIEVTGAEHDKLRALGREMNDRTPAEVARGIVGAFLEKIPKPVSRPSGSRSSTGCAAAMLLAYKLYKKAGRRFTFESLAEAYDNQWPVHAIRARLSTLRRRGELNYCQLSDGGFQFTDV